MKLHLTVIALSLTTLIFAQKENSHMQERNVASIKKIASPIEVDGELDDMWSLATINLINNTTGGFICDPQDLSANWKGLWTTTHLYLFVTVTDDKKLMDSPGHRYRDDQIEVFVTSDNQKPNDYWTPKNNNTFAYENPRGEASRESHKGLKGHVSGQKETPTGWTFELAIPFTDWGIDPKEGYKIGIDVQVNDDDEQNEGEEKYKRDAKISWNSLSDVDGGVAFNPLMQGTAVFEK